MNGKDTLNFIVQYGTQAERLALDTSLIKPLTAWYETDTGNEYKWFGSWVNYPGAASGASFNGQGQVGDYVSVTKIATLPLSPFCHMSDGKYLCTDGPNGDSARKFYLYDGDILKAPSGGTITAVNTWSFSISSGANGGKSADGTINVSGSGCAFRFALQLASGAILFITTGATAATYVAGGAYGNLSANYFVYRASPTSTVKYAIGNDLNGTNQRAVLQLGTSDGVSNTQSSDVRILHSRSVCEATVQITPGAAPIKKLLIAEYNVNGSRTPGGLNDAVRVWQSLDDGLTWTALLTFNTNGTHLINHFHSVVQDPKTGLIYLMTGDDDTGTYSQNGVIVWDGISAPPPANSPFSVYQTTPGWNCIYGNELCRYGDIAFGDTDMYGLPDSDNEQQETYTDAFRGMVIDRKLNYISAGRSFERQGDIPPLIAITIRKERRRYILSAASGASSTIQCKQHRLLNGQPVKVTSTLTVPNPLSKETIYYVGVIDADNITLSATLGGSPIVVTNSGTGNVCIIIDPGLTGGYFYGCLRTQSAITANEPYMHFWASYSGVDWAFVAKCKNYNVGQTASIKELWQDKAGNIIASSRYAQGLDFTSGTAQSASCVIFRSNRVVAQPYTLIYD